jgi:ABC-type phosphate/phosphonate transport system substrate-binding protein
VIASLPMYDMPEVRAFTDAWWKGLARHMGVVAGLDRLPDYFQIWRNPQLVFSQTCGYPLTHEFRGKLRLLATPHYGVDGCSGSSYRSIFFAREQRPLPEFRGSVAAYNNMDSMSGMLALKLVFLPFANGGQFFAKSRQTGSHLESLAAVQSGNADICAIDAVTVAMARRYRPSAMEGLVEVGRSPSVPSLPYVTSMKRTISEVERYRQGLAAAFSDTALAKTRAALFLDGFSVLSEADYDVIAALEQKIDLQGGLEL